MQFQDDIVISTIDELQTIVGFRSQRRGTYLRMNPLLYHIYEDDIDQSKFESNARLWGIQNRRPYSLN